MADRCLHGMPTPASCFDCMEAGNLDPAPRPDPERAVASTTARYPGRCDACTRDIEEGDVIVHTTRERWIHKECIDG